MFLVNQQVFGSDEQFSTIFGPLWTGSIILLTSGLLLAQCCNKKTNKEKKGATAGPKKGEAKAKIKKEDNKKKSPEAISKAGGGQPATTPPTLPGLNQDGAAPIGNEGIAKEQQKQTGENDQQKAPIKRDAPPATAHSGKDRKSPLSPRSQNKTKEEETNDSYRDRDAQADFKVPDNKSRPSAEDDGYRTLIEVMGKDYYKEQRTQSTKTSKSKSTTTGLAELDAVNSEGQSSANSEPAQKLMTNSTQRRESQVNVD